MDTYNKGRRVRGGGVDERGVSGWVEGVKGVRREGAGGTMDTLSNWNPL